MADERPWAGRRLHLIGLGGAGMSGYARVATQLGAAVSGSDRADSGGLRALAELGVEVHVGHAAANVPAGEGVEVVHSTAIPRENPERAAARERGSCWRSSARSSERSPSPAHTARPRRRR
jgi:UDP-N-acetylmuramate--alanine ligase